MPRKNPLFKRLFLMSKWEYQTHYLETSQLIPAEVKRFLLQEAETIVRPEVKKLTRELIRVFKEWLENHTCYSACDDSAAYFRWRTGYYSFRRINPFFPHLMQATSQPLHRNLVVINQAINILHSSGSMLEYLADRYHATEADFAFLSNLPRAITKTWEYELTKRGWTHLPTGKQLLPDCPEHL